MHPGGRWVNLGSSGSSGCTLAVARFVWVPLVPLGEPWRSFLVSASGSWMSLGSIGFVWFVRVCPGGHWILPGSSCSCGCVLCVAGFSRARLVRPDAPPV